MLTFLPSVLTAVDAYGPVTEIMAPKGHLSEVLAEFASSEAGASYLPLTKEGADARLHVKAGGTWWYYGGLV